MPSRNGRRQQGAKDQTVAETVARSAPKRRKLGFEAEPWYAATLAKMSAVRKTSELKEVAAVPLAPE
jgi:hypothetical protein